MAQTEAETEYALRAMLMDGSGPHERAAIITMLAEIAARQIDRIDADLARNGYPSAIPVGQAETRLAHAEYRALQARIEGHNDDSDGRRSGL